MKTYRYAFALWLVIALLMVGCGGPQETEPEAVGKTAEPKVEQIVATQTPQTGSSATSKQEPTPKPTEPPAAEEEILAYDQTSSLDGLDSYRLKNVISFSEEDGESSTVELEIEYVREPQAQRMFIRSRDASSDEVSEMEMIRIGSDSYVRWGDEWMSMQVDEEDFFPESSMLYQPEYIFEDAEGRYVGTETVNGIRAKHYVYDKEALAKTGLFESLVTASGEVWVSVDDEVVVRAVAKLEGKDESTDKMVTIETESEVWDINAPIVINPPEGVGRAQIPDDIPVMDGAREMVVIQQMISYKVDKGVDVVIAFYKEQMKANGWTSEESMMSGFLAFAKGERSVQVVIQEQGEQTGVAIMLGEE